jgi:hypothetical protein
MVERQYGRDGGWPPMNSTQLKRSQDYGTLVRELELLYLTTRDIRLSAAIDALRELFPGAADTPLKNKRGRKAKWDEFRLMILWIFVQAHVQSKMMTVSAACAFIVQSGERLAVDNRSKGALERRYYEAVKHLKTNPEIETEWRYEADNFAASLPMKRKSTSFRIRSLKK